MQHADTEQNALATRPAEPAHVVELGLDDGIHAFETDATRPLSPAHHARLRRLRLRAIAGTNGVLASTIFVFLLLPGAPEPKWLAALGAAVCVATSVYQVRMASREDMPAYLFGVGSLAMTTGALLLEIYFGAMSPLCAVIAVGIFVHAMNDGSRWPKVILLYATVAHLIIAVLETDGYLLSREFLWDGVPPPVALKYSAHVLVACLFVAAYAAATRIRQEGDTMLEALEDAVREATAHGVLLAEAREELDRARSGDSGRFSGARLGRFTLGKLIGRGGMGEVYSANDSEDGGSAAVKVLRFGGGHVDSLALARFARECAALQSIESQFVVKVLDVGGPAAPMPYLAMERLQGEDLGDRLERSGVLSPSEAAELVRCAASALTAAHDAGVIHRDLKPANIFRTITPEGVSWRVLDFGVAALRAEPSALTSQFQVGTLAYMAPELRDGISRVDERADVYGLALITLEAITGFSPIETRRDRALGQRSPDATARREAALASLPEVLAAVIREGLAPQRSDRTPTPARFASGFALALRELERTGESWTQPDDSGSVTLAG